MIWCLIFGHKLRVYAKPKEEWAKGIRWLVCDRCNRHFAINDRVKTIVPMDFEIRDMHEWDFLEAHTTHYKPGK